MLILTRRIGEVLMIGDNVKVKVCAVRGGQVSLGIEAPRAIPVHRQEIYDRIKAETPVHLDDEERFGERPERVDPQTGYVEDR